MKAELSAPQSSEAVAFERAKQLIEWSSALRRPSGPNFSDSSAKFSHRRALFIPTRGGRDFPLKRRKSPGSVAAPKDQAMRNPVNVNVLTASETRMELRCFAIRRVGSKARKWHESPQGSNAQVTEAHYEARRGATRNEVVRGEGTQEITWLENNSKVDVIELCDFSGMDGAGVLSEAVR
jgi:hypothetical protein